MVYHYRWWGTYKCKAFISIKPHSTYLTFLYHPINFVKIQDSGIKFFISQRKHTCFLIHNTYIYIYFIIVTLLALLYQPIEFVKIQDSNSLFRIINIPVSCYTCNKYIYIYIIIVTHLSFVYQLINFVKIQN